MGSCLRGDFIQNLWGAAAVGNAAGLLKLFGFLQKLKGFGRKFVEI
jgi:hypothetical protein